MFTNYQDTFYCYIPTSYEPKEKWACFDLDWTLTYSEQRLFPQDPKDIHLLPHRRRILKKFAKHHTIIIFTNQKVKSKSEVQKKLDRMTTFINKIKIPVVVCVATGNDSYRKPGRGMYDFCINKFGIPKQVFFCGDAGGRKGDFSDSDLEFAKTCGIKFKVPEKVFKQKPLPIFPQTHHMIIFVGMPGVGKTTFYNQNLKSLGYEWINQDNLKTHKNCLTKLDMATVCGVNVCIDATNPKRETRDEYRDIAQKEGYTVTVIYFTGNGYNRNQLRGTEKVPTIAYHMYFKNLNPPTKKEGELICV